MANLNLGVVTAYGYAKDNGYTGTEEQFAELMASYASVAEQAAQSATDAAGAKTDAESARDAAVEAKNLAVSAKEDAQSARDTATGAAGTATSKASEAAGYAGTASTKATAAANSATEASGYAGTATTKAGQASDSATAANTSKEAAADSAEDSEAWAVGQVNGTDVASSAAQYHNNSKYYSQQAADSATAAAASAASLTIDSATSTTSTNALQNKVITGELNDLKNDFDNFSGVDGVSAQSINGSANIETAITETITQNKYWYPTGSGTIANGGTREGMDKAVFDITNMSGKIAIGFDPNANYGAMVIGLSSSAVSPYTRVTYFSVSNVQNTPNYFTVNGNVATADLDAIKLAYPTAVLMFVNVPHDVWKLDNIITFKKTLHWLSITGYVPSIIVAADGSGDYTTIAEAVSAASDGDTIYIRDGEYKETVIINKYLHLVGQSKQGTILYNNVGDYDNSPLCITQGSVCNMTIKSIAPNDTSGLEDYAYAVHLDKNFSTTYGKCEIYNCNIYSEVNDAIGAGTNYAQVFDLHDNWIYVAENPVKTGSCGFKCHFGQYQTGGKITLKNNTIIAVGSNGTSFCDVLFDMGGYTSDVTVEVELVGNVCKTYYNGSATNFVLNDYCYGNSVAEMNTLS